MSPAIDRLCQQFLCGVSVPKIDFSDVIHDLSDTNCGEANQLILISRTINHPLVLQYPVRVEYQLSFTRQLLKELERAGADILDCLYERHVQLLHSANGEKVYRHFLLSNGSIASVRESMSIISDGTTGLCVWQAANVLINWCFKNSTLLKKSTVLELGSGVGVCGIAVSLLCCPSKYIFSDCHPLVMNVLIENIKLNFAKEDSSKDSELSGTEVASRIMWSGNLSDSKLVVAHLPWEDIVDDHLAPLLAPNFVIASDVVYDPSLFDPLSKTVQEFAFAGSQVILACTERNSVTLEGFMNILGGLGLKVVEESAPDSCAVPVCDDWQVKIFRISKQ